LCMEAGFKDIRSVCCPENLPVPENPCIVCLGGITAGDNFAPFAEDEDSTTCKQLVDFCCYVRSWVRVVHIEPSLIHPN
jgi:hypothetical protein